MSQLLAYHNDPKIKKAAVAKMAAHRKGDELVQGYILKALNDKIISVDPLSGKVFSNRFNPPKELGCKSTRGYKVATLHMNGERRQIKLHQVVWVYVNGLISSNLMIDHINRDKSDNRICNLRLSNALENSRNRRSYKGSENPSAKLNENQVLEIKNRVLSGTSRSSVAKEFNISKSLVNLIMRGKIWMKEAG